MNLYHIIREDEHGYDQFSNAVVCAADQETARNMNPKTGKPMTQEDWGESFSSWTDSPDKVIVVCIGTARDSIPEGVVCASFHAG